MMPDSLDLQHRGALAPRLRTTTHLPTEIWVQILAQAQLNPVELTRLQAGVPNRALFGATHAPQLWEGLSVPTKTLPVPKSFYVRVRNMSAGERHDLRRAWMSSPPALAPILVKYRAYFPPDIAIAMLRKGLNPMHLPPVALKNRDVLLEAVQRCGNAIAHALPKFRADRQIVCAAVAQFGSDVLPYVDPALRNDPKILAATREHVAHAD